jgi:hypothetical protein
MRQDRHWPGRTRRQGIALLGMLAVLLVTSTVPGEARGGHGLHGFGHGFHRFGHGHHGFIGPRIGVSIGPYWDPYLDPYGYPPVITPAPQVYIQPAPEAPGQPPPTPPSWYYCDDPQGYYPYVQQCPDGWRPVAPTPP